MSLKATNIDFRKRFQWRLEFETSTGGPSIEVAQMVSCTFPTAEIGRLTIKSAQSMMDDKLPARLNYGDIVLGRVLVQKAADLSVFEWFRSAMNPVDGSAEIPSRLRRTAHLISLSDQGKDIEVVKLYRAWACKIEGDPFDGSSDAWVEKVTISYDWMDRTPASQGATVQ